jgi:hypothetical protein
VSAPHHSGATQWRVICDHCGNPVSDCLRMHSQISKSNLTYFIEEDRLREDLDESDLLERYQRAAGALVVCNNCGTIREVDSA